jgi:hypothetical protein
MREERERNEKICNLDRLVNELCVEHPNATVTMLQSSTYQMTVITAVVVWGIVDEHSR